MWKPTTSSQELMHSAKGTSWGKHKYIAIKNGRYIYPEDVNRKIPAGSAAGRLISGAKSAYNTVSSTYNKLTDKNAASKSGKAIGKRLSDWEQSQKKAYADAKKRIADEQAYRTARSKEVHRSINNKIAGTINGVKSNANAGVNRAKSGINTAKRNAEIAANEAKAKARGTSAATRAKANQTKYRAQQGAANAANSAKRTANNAKASIKNAGSTAKKNFKTGKAVARENISALNRKAQRKIDKAKQNVLNYLSKQADKASSSLKKKSKKLGNKRYH